jgi:hypothetical protein
MIHQLIFP